MTDRTAELIARDAAVIAGVEKLRFFPATMASGKGAELTDLEGKTYVDLTSTWTAAGLGYGHPRVAEAVAQAYQAPPSAGLSIMHETAVRLGERLLELVAGTDDRRVYLGLAGSDAWQRCGSGGRHPRHEADDLLGHLVAESLQLRLVGDVGARPGVSGTDDGWCLRVVRAELVEQRRGDQGHDASFQRVAQGAETGLRSTTTLAAADLRAVRPR